MSDTPTFKAFEHEGWQQSVEQYDESFGRLTRQMIPRLLEVLQIEPGRRVLDVACGPGYLAAAAAELGADVLGIDFASSMVSLARQYYPTLAFQEGDAENLDMNDASFDAVAINFGILHLGEPERALYEAFRVLKPGGRVGFTIWAPPVQALGFQIVLKAIDQWGNPNVPLPPAPPFFYYSDPDVARKALEDAGFSHSVVEQVPLRWELHDADELFEAFYHGTARTGGLLRRQSSEALSRIREAVRAATGAYKIGNQIVVPMPAMLAWAERTSSS